MSNILIYSNNKDFADDLILQTIRYVPEFVITDDEDIIPDVAVIDEDTEKFMQIREQYKNIPLIFLSSDNQKILQSRLNISIKKPFQLMKFFDILKSANNKLDNTVDGYLVFGIYELHPSEKEIKVKKAKNFDFDETRSNNRLNSLDFYYVTSTDVLTQIFK